MLLLITVIVGLALLFFGRRLFWLFVAAAGFFTGVALVTRFWHGPESVAILVGLAVGIAFAFLAIAVRSIAIGLAGFLLGGAALLAIANLLGLTRADLIIYLIGGILGIIFIGVLFDWALIGISSFAGASLLIKAIGAERPIAAAAFVILLVAGIAVQSSHKHREPKSDA